jgi:branched-chain amino acid transport system substrate-binding protein
MSRLISSPSSLNRRGFLIGSAGLLTTASAFRFPTPAIAQGAPLKVGLMLPYSGTFAKLGKFIDDGFRLYVEQNGGSLGGRRIEIVQIDDESKPESATDNRTGSWAAIRSISCSEPSILASPWQW